MNDSEELIAAFQIFLRYGYTQGITHQDHYGIYAGPDYELVSEEDLATLREYGWNPDLETGTGFYKFT